METNSLEGRLAVYTVLMGQVAELNPVPSASNVDFICFTDQNLDESKGWTVRLVEPRIPGDSPRSSRHPKVNPHLYLQDYSRSIYVDTSVKLLVDPEHFWSRLVPTSEIVFGAIHHSFVFTMLEEMRVISALGYEQNSVLMRYLESTKDKFPGYLNVRPIWGGVLARRHNTKDLKASMESWFSDILNFSRRDQLSLPVALRILRGNEVHLSHMDLHASDFHIWPSAGYQKPPSYTFGLTGHANVDWSATGRFERDSLIVERDSLIVERDSLIVERDSLLKSKSWKLTAPLRAMRDIVIPEKK